MPNVKFTSALKRFYPDLQDTVVEGQTVSDLLEHINNTYPGIRQYLIDEDGSLRQHVNIFIDEELIHDRSNLTDAIDTANEVLIYQALSGG
uniref:MoaD/ThiS family protein n=1 Tax=Roseihalotalea indica TaxID=2867963 RepID=A0AA49JFA2_9BACT|nr:MoaD/ThiS family protein [Tunicatimonas sp. TK19036]